jgi:hypothetical protein
MQKADRIFGLPLIYFIDFLTIYQQAQPKRMRDEVHFLEYRGTFREWQVRARDSPRGKGQARAL